MTAAETTPAAEAMMAAETIPAEAAMTAAEAIPAPEATIPEVAARARALEAEPVLPEKCQRRVEQIPRPEPVQP